MKTAQITYSFDNSFQIEKLDQTKLAAIMDYTFMIVIKVLLKSIMIEL
jgi:hypothetical protein